MKKIELQNDWPESWKYSYPYDLLEVYGEKNCYGSAYAYATRRKHTLELVQKVAQPGAKVLDVGAAQGNFSLLLAELGYEVTWNDLRIELADYVRLKYEYGTIHYVPGEVFSLGFDACFDVVLITEIIEHVAHPNQFLQKIGTLVKAGGHIIMTTPNGEYFLNTLPKFSECSDPAQFESIQFGPNSDDHIFLLHLDEISQLEQQASLTILETRLFTNPLTNGHIKLERLLKLIPRSFVDYFEKFTCYLPLVVRRRIHVGMAILFTR